MSLWGVWVWSKQKFDGIKLKRRRDVSVGDLRDHWETTSCLVSWNHAISSRLSTSVKILFFQLDKKMKKYWRKVWKVDTKNPTFPSYLKPLTSFSAVWRGSTSLAANPSLTIVASESPTQLQNFCINHDWMSTSRMQMNVINQVINRVINQVINQVIKLSIKWSIK